MRISFQVRTKWKNPDAGERPASVAGVKEGWAARCGKHSGVHSARTKFLQTRVCDACENQGC